MQMTFVDYESSPIFIYFFRRINLNIFRILLLLITTKQYNENIKNHNVPENSEPEKKRKTKFYNNLRLDQCERNPKTNSELTSFFFCTFRAETKKKFN